MIGIAEFKFVLKESSNDGSIFGMEDKPLSFEIYKNDEIDGCIDIPMSLNDFKNKNYTDDDAFLIGTTLGNLIADYLIELTK